MTCNYRCWFAKTNKEKCKCCCNGSNHGKGYPDSDPDEMAEIRLTEIEAKPYKEQYTRITCRCGKNILNESILGYGYHPDGWILKGYSKNPYWLYVHCPKCGYEIAIWKLGVPREKQEVIDKFLNMGG